MPGAVVRVAKRHLLSHGHRGEVRAVVEVEARLLARRTPAAVTLAAVERRILVNGERAAMADCW